MKLLLAALAACLGLQLSSVRSVHADAYVMFSAGGLLPVGDADWEDSIDSSLTLGARAGVASKAGRGARLAFEATLEYAPLSPDFASSLFDVELSRYRLLGGVRYETLVTRGAVLSLHAGLGFAHLAIDVTGPLGQGSDTDNGLALDLGAGLWFGVSRTALLGVDVSLPTGFHEDNDPDDDAELDLRTTELALTFGARISL